MAFSRTKPMYFLRDHRGTAAGTPVKLRASNLSRFRLLASKGVVGTQADMDSEDKTAERVAAQETPVVLEVTEETPVVPEVTEETPVVPEDKAKRKAPAKRGKKKGK